MFGYDWLRTERELTELNRDEAAVEYDGKLFIYRVRQNNCSLFKKRMLSRFNKPDTGYYKIKGKYPNYRLVKIF